MNNQQKSEIMSLRQKGYGYTKIARALGMSKNTVKSYCQRNNLTSERLAESSESMSASANLSVLSTVPALSAIGTVYCPECGKPIAQVQGRKEKKFCSDECRHKWWNAHPERITRKAVYSYTCAGCGKRFTAYGNSKRKYCSHVCYISNRFNSSVSCEDGGNDE